jgi:hypothetical protein
VIDDVLAEACGSRSLVIKSKSRDTTALAIVNPSIGVNGVHKTPDASKQSSSAHCADTRVFTGVLHERGLGPSYFSIQTPNPILRSRSF